jgi:hypothetical protein
MKRLLSAALLAIACGSEEPADEPVLSRDELLDPETCRDCHADHYREWSGSMHAYASEDPVFVAMNARGQEETLGELGGFCVSCHAPMALREGATTNGTNLAELPAKLRGVTCYFCHNIESVDGDHNALISLANDVTMRGGISDPVKNTAHRSAYSPHFDRKKPESAAACGACHDIVLPSPPAPAAVHLERTFAEWKETIFSGKDDNDLRTCASCHLASIPNSVIADAPGVVTRPARHVHTFPGVDLALTPFPEAAEQRAQVESMLDVTLRAELCVVELPGNSVIEALLDNVGAGHRWPSGAAQDRRAWVEIRAYSGTSEIYASGVIADGEPASESTDPDLWLLRDGVSDATGGEAHMFWEVASYDNDCASAAPGCTIPGPVTIDPAHPDYYITHVVRRFPKSTTLASVPDRVTLRVKLRPMGLEVLDDLVQTGDLVDAVKDAMPTLDLLPNRESSDVALEWTPEATDDPLYGFTKTISGLGAARCVSNGLRKQ